jgi:hypothetical protein
MRAGHGTIGKSMVLVPRIRFMLDPHLKITIASLYD